MYMLCQLRACLHTIESSFMQQMARLHAVGHQRHLVGQVCEALTKWVSEMSDQKGPKDKRKRSAVIPFVHTMSHGIKDVAKCFSAELASSAPGKPTGM